MIRCNRADDFRFELVGRNKATTFTGFCHRHDSTLFAPIDFNGGRVFDPMNVEQAVIFSLRSVAREYWLKLRNLQAYSMIHDHAANGDVEGLKRIMNIDNQDASQLIDDLGSIRAFLNGTKCSTNRLGRTFGSLLTQVRRKDYHLSHVKRYLLPGVSNVAASAVFNPEFDLAGARIGSLALNADVVDAVLNIVPLDHNTWIIVLYHKKNADRLVSFFSQMDRLLEEDLRILMSKLIIMHCENVVFAPAYIDEISTSARLMIEKAFENTLFSAVSYDQFPKIDLFSERKENQGEKENNGDVHIIVESSGNSVK
jgi:hypothetical protein